MEFSTSGSIVEAMLQKVISYSFYLLFFLTPPFWTSKNFELFEYNKMMLVYGLTVIITGSWLLKIVNRKSLIVNRTALDIPLLLFLAANILSTVFSIDPHTSIWGYYSRSNGGLLSLISYLLLYWAFVSNIKKDKIFNYLKTAIFSGVFISIWAILEHFGVSFSCVILRGEFNANCWIQDVQARVFATLGQPNWLAAYLAMLIFPCIYFVLTASSRLTSIPYTLYSILLYLAFTFTYSRGPSLGFLAGFGFLIVLTGLYIPLKNIKWLGIIFVAFLSINIFFGSALTSFRLISRFAPPPRPSINLPKTPSGTQLENGGTESGQIRLIVWKGAFDIFKHYPIFGTGVETFAYSYYQFRPVAHNLTSEWDFLYNKAHNEFLNYLATTGIIGFLSYISIIITFIFFCIKQKSLLVIVLLASYISFLVQAFFLFSVVTTALLFFLFPAIAFVATGSVKPVKLSFSLYRPIYFKIAKSLVILSAIYLLYSILQFWYADTLFAKGQSSSESGSPGKAYNLLAEAVNINRLEPFYRSELGYAAALSAIALEDTDATLSARLIEDALRETKLSLDISPKNVSYWRTAIRTYFELSDIDLTLDALNKSIALAPTDPKLYLTKATILQSIGKNNEAKEALKKAIELKPNYQEAKANLDKLK